MAKQFVLWQTIDLTKGGLWRIRKKRIGFVVDDYGGDMKLCNYFPLAHHSKFQEKCGEKEWKIIKKRKNENKKSFVDGMS